MVAVDTNLLLYALHPAAPEHLRARAALSQARADERGWGFTIGTVAEFWSVATRPAPGGALATPEEAAAFLASLHRAGAQIWQMGPEGGVRLLAAARVHGVCGRRIFDLQIALAARDNGATELWTHDRSFLGLPGLAIRDPLVP